MQGDATPLTATGHEGTSGTRKGPRHAAARKSLLARLQRPAGKAIALAAMPTAVLVGMGLTPRPALAEDKDIPFAPGPCVTRSDEPAGSEPPEPSGPSGTTKPSPGPSRSSALAPAPAPSESADADDESEGNGDTEEGDERRSGTSPSPSASASASAGTAPGTPTGPARSTPPPGGAASAGKTTNPLDPLGLGDALKDLIDGPGGQDTATPSPKPTASDTAPDTAKPASRPSSKPATDPGDRAPDGTADRVNKAGSADNADTANKAGSADKAEDDAPDKAHDKAEDTSEDTSEDEANDRAEDAIRDAAARAGAKVEELGEDVKGRDPKRDEDIPDGAKPRFPCPTADPEALAAAELEQGLPLLPDEPWILKSSKLTLSGLDYHGIVEVKTGSGKIKKVLKFTASGVDIGNLHQLVQGPLGRTGHVEARKGSTSTIREGTVTMYTEELKGNLFGLIPVTFSPESPPPLDIPYAVFTDVTVTQAGQFGGTLTIPGLHNYYTDADTDTDD
ncbi:hypothetical protein ACWF94_02820 [Streptomyces sp. NPDC055078]